MNDLNNKIINYFRSICSTDRLAPAYLFIGENDKLISDVFKTIACKDSEMFCGKCWDCLKINELKHPDLRIIEPDTISIKIDAIRKAQGFLALKAYKLNKKILYIRNADTMGIDASNAFLKTLEEPPENSVIILNTNKTDGLLPTIVSRCRKIFIPNVSVTDKMDKSLIISFLRGDKIKIGKRDLLMNFFSDLAKLVHEELISRVNGESEFYDDDISSFLEQYTGEELEIIMDKILEVWMSSMSVNENLAFNVLNAYMKN
ncbi:MAG: hypothetical protein PHP69_03585 [Candidatus Omnitrophica bacterium]|nr:hypothetical protein [Candidatus Omnitrophota bacterium]MDD5081126.1 hypothetical protein [Candidatus Omnitrophota bacterium]MDD5441596.1 hypothetical protein [Candidatus Omnitrophota bacterium]